jgi:hypothetical protein
MISVINDVRIKEMARPRSVTWVLCGEGWMSRVRRRIATMGMPRA